ncbi:MutS-related protein [Acidithiobacillus sp. AC3]
MLPHLLDPEKSLAAFPASAQEQHLVEDLGLAPLFTAMAEDDDERREIVERVILRWRCRDAATVRYRQEALTDLSAQPERAEAIFAIAQNSLDLPGQSHQFLLFSKSPSRRLRANTALMQELLRQLQALRDLGSATFHSDALRKLFSRLQQEIDEGFLQAAQEALAALQLDEGVRSTAGADAAGRCVPEALHGGIGNQGWLGKLWRTQHEDAGFSIADRDEAGQTALGKLREQLLTQTAQVLDDAVARVLQFFRLLRDELHFYLAAITLQQKLRQQGLSCCLPEVQEEGGLLSATELYSPLLPLRGESTVSNDIAARHTPLIIITGANRGGKSTLLRAIGISQLWAESGLYSFAKTMHTSLCQGIFSHFQQEEDAKLQHGKFAEELQRMQDIVPELRTGSLILFNESFAATNEQEGSEIARQITLALRDAGVRVIFVTHLYSFAKNLFNKEGENILFLRASAEPEAQRFQLLPGAPQASSLAREIYQKIF